MEVEETSWMQSWDKSEIASSMIHRQIVLHIGRGDENVGDKCIIVVWMKKFLLSVVVSRMLERQWKTEKEAQ